MKFPLHFLFSLLVLATLFTKSANASNMNSCLLTGKLLEKPQQLIKSISRTDANGQTIPNTEYEISEFEIRVLITHSKIVGRTDSRCMLPNNQPYELSISLPKAYDLINSKKGDSIKLLHIVRDFDSNPNSNMLDEYRLYRNRKKGR